MATITAAPAHSWNLTESRRRVQHPLQRLRGYIRLYVLAEGLAVFCLYLALWFWIGMALDYGFFALFRVDWIQVWPWSLRGTRAGMLVLLRWAWSWR